MGLLRRGAAWVSGAEKGHRGAELDIALAGKAVAAGSGAARADDQVGQAIAVDVARAEDAAA
jgi:hypothetical protein